MGAVARVLILLSLAAGTYGLAYAAPVCIGQGGTYGGTTVTTSCAGGVPGAYPFGTLFQAAGTPACTFNFSPAVAGSSFSSVLTNVDDWGSPETATYAFNGVTYALSVGELPAGFALLGNGAKATSGANTSGTINFSSAPALISSATLTAANVASPHGYYGAVCFEPAAVTPTMSGLPLMLFAALLFGVLVWYQRRRV